METKIKELTASFEDERQKLTDSYEKKFEELRTQNESMDSKHQQNMDEITSSLRVNMRTRCHTDHTKKNKYSPIVYG